MEDPARTAPARREAVLQAVEGYASAMAKSLSDAIRIPSVNPKYPGQNYSNIVGAEEDMSSLMADLYRSAGAAVEMVAVEKGRANACARITGTGEGQSLALNGHVDVVPAEAWARWERGPFDGQITDEAVIGRGATDMKSGLIAHAYAAKALRDAGIRLRGDLVMHAVVGEEVGDHLAGTSAVLEAGYGADAAIVCEPTNVYDGPPVVSPTAPGLLWFSVTLVGKTAHAGFRGHALHSTLDGHRLGVNAVDKMWIVYHALRQLEDEWAHRDRHPLFVPGHFSILPGVVRANPEGIEVPFFLSDTATIEYCALHHPDRSNDEVVDEIRRAVERACASDPWLRDHQPTIDWKLVWPPYVTSPGHRIVETVINAHQEVLGGHDANAIQGGFFGVCDITWLERGGVPGIIYGPGVAKTAHAENEYVPIHQMITAAKTYALAAMDYCGVAEEE